MSTSEVARLREEIERACEASWQALYGLAAGSAQHEVISARLRRMDDCHQRLSELLGDEQAVELVCQVYNRVSETYAPVPESSTQPVTCQTSVHSIAQAKFRKIVLVQEEK
jgi:hypothetical protein